MHGSNQRLLLAARCSGINTSKAKECLETTIGVPTVGEDVTVGEKPHVEAHNPPKKNIILDHFESIAQSSKSRARKKL